MLHRCWMFWILLLYGFAISTVAPTSDKPSTSKSDLELDRFVSAGSVHFYALAEQPKLGISKVQEPFFTKINESFRLYGSLANQKIHLLELSFLQHSAFINNFPIAFSKAYIVFPFHGFW